LKCVESVYNANVTKRKSWKKERPTTRVHGHKKKNKKAWITRS